MRIFARRDDAPDGPAATYAAVLDGAHLWWHVPGHDRLTLREVGGRAEVGVEVDPFPLAGLTAPAYDVLAGGRPVVAASLPDRAPARAPLAPDGRTQYDVTLDGGQLRVVRAEVPATATLLSAALADDRIVLRIAPPAGTSAASLLLTDERDAVVATVPVEAGSDTSVVAHLSVADLPDDHVGVLRVLVGTAASRVRVRRDDTGLADPNHAVLLPELADAADPDRTRARLRWSPDSLLALRVLDPRADTGDTGGAASAAGMRSA